MDKSDLLITTDENIDSVVRIKEIASLYRQSFPAIFISLIIASFVVAILWPVQQHKMLIIWFSGIVFAAMIRIALFIRYRQIQPQGESLLNWEKPYLLTHTAIILIWGLGSVWIMPKDSLLYQSVLYFFLMGIAGGSLAVYAAHRAVTLISIFGVLLPATIWLFLYGNNLIATCMATASILFFISAIRVTANNEQARHENIVLTHKLKESTQHAETLARRDALTGLFNRRAFYESAELLSKANARSQEDFSLVLLDIDQFKHINDSFGHAAGNVALQHFAHLILHTLRDADICARIGGDEFAILLSATPILEAIQTAERLREIIATTPISFNNKDITITASIGVTSGRGDIETLLHHADIAMYRAKNEGRNRVISADNIAADIPVQETA